MNNSSIAKKGLGWRLLVIAAVLFLFLFYVLGMNISTQALTWIKVLALLLPAPVISILIAAWMPTQEWNTTGKIGILIGVSFVFLLIWSYLLFGIGWSEIHGGSTSYADISIGSYVLFFTIFQIVLAPAWAIADTCLYLGGREIRRKHSPGMRNLGIAGVLVGTIMWMLTAVLASNLVAWGIEM